MRRLGLVLVLTTAVLGLQTTSALAETASTKAAESSGNAAAPGPPTNRSKWYGWQILAVDVAGVATGITLSSTLNFEEAEQPSDLGLVGATWYGVGAIGAPAIHYLHGNGGNGAASLGMRLALPPLSGFFGFFGTCLGRGDFEHECVVDGYTVGSVVGLVGASAFDAALLAWDRPARDLGPLKTWYGWQTLSLDAAAIASGIALVARNSPSDDGEHQHPALGPWVMDYLVGMVGGPVIHFTHGNWGTGFISLGARAVVGPMFVVPGIAGYCGATAGVTNCSKTGAVYGLLGGLVAVDLFDAFVLAHDDPEPAEQAYAPYITMGPQSVVVGGYF